MVSYLLIVVNYTSVAKIKWMVCDEYTIGKNSLKIEVE